MIQSGSTQQRALGCVCSNYWQIFFSLGHQPFFSHTDRPQREVESRVLILSQYNSIPESSPTVHSTMHHWHLRLDPSLGWGHRVHCRMLNSVPASTHQMPIASWSPAVTTKNVSRHFPVCTGGKNRRWVGTAELETLMTEEWFSPFSYLRST